MICRNMNQQISKRETVVPGGAPDFGTLRCSPALMAATGSPTAGVDAWTRRLRLASTLTATLMVATADGTKPAASFSPPLPPPPTPVVESQPPPPDLTVVRIAPDEYRLGPVNLNKATDTVRLPVAINAQALGAPLEYLLVTQDGKVHESLLVTSTSATQIRLAMLLLGWRGTNEAVTLTLEWPAGAKSAVTAPEHLLTTKDHALRPLEPAWEVQAIDADGHPPATPAGQIVALIPDSGALIGYRGWGATTDVLWTARTNDIPATVDGLSLTVRRRKTVPGEVVP